MRIFFAIWPPAEAARALAQWAREAHRLTGGTLTAEDKIHLTLAFLGDADHDRAIRAARTVEGESHHLPIEEARYWRHNRIVWAGPRETPPKLEALFKRLELALFREDFILERRPFAAHVTLLRKAPEQPLPPLPRADWPVGEFALVRSAGGAYETLERFGLG